MALSDIAKILQSGREAQADKWRKIYEGKNALEAFENMVHTIYSDKLKEVIAERADEYAITPDEAQITRLLVQKIQYLFLIHYRIRKEGLSKCSKP